jgi:hypothetical protein
MGPEGIFVTLETKTSRNSIKHKLQKNIVIDLFFERFEAIIIIKNYSNVAVFSQISYQIVSGSFIQNPSQSAENFHAKNCSYISSDNEIST